MKGRICILAIVLCMLTGCGKKEYQYYTPEEAAINYVTMTTTTTKKKRQEITTTTTVSTDSLSQVTTAISQEDTSEDQTYLETSAGITDNESIENTNSQTKTTVIEVADTEVIKNNATESSVELDDDDIYYLEGVVYEVTDKYVLINEVDLSIMKVTFSDSSQISDIEVGDTVEITYNGLVNDGYTSYAYDAYSIDVTRKVEKDYELKEYECNGMSYTILLPEGWESKVIEYPQDDDFTDWGIRFSPTGSSGSMDVCWHSTFKVTVSMTKVPKQMYGREIVEYSQSGVWKFIDFNNGYLAANNFNDYQFEKYAEEMDFMLSTLEFSE